MVGPERRLSFPLKKHPLRECNIWPVIQREKAQASAKYHFSNNEHSITAISCVQQKMMVVNKKFGPTFEKKSGNWDPTVNILPPLVKSCDFIQAEQLVLCDFSFFKNHFVSYCFMRVLEKLLNEGCTLLAWLDFHLIFV